MFLRCALAALVMATTPAPPSTNRPSDAVLAPATIDASGATDVTAALNQFFTSVPNGKIIELRPGGNYRIDGTLQLADRHDIVLDGQGARIFAGTEGARDRSHLWIDHGSDIVIRNLVIKGAHPDGGLAPDAWRSDKAFQHGILVQGASNVELDHVHITDVFGDLVSIAWAHDGTWCDGVWVHDSYLARNGRQGISVTGARNVLIEHNTITTTRRATVDLEPDLPKYGAVNVHIVDNDIGPGVLRFVAAHGNGPVSDVVIARNHLHGRDLAVDVEAPVGTRRSNFYVLDNTSDKQAGSTPLRFTRLDGVVVEHNVQPVVGQTPAVLAADVCGLALAGNTFPGAAPVVSATGATCARPTAAPMPPTPDLAARIPARRIGSTAEPPSTTTTTGAPRVTRPAFDQGSSSSGLDAGSWGIIAAGVGLVGLAVLGMSARRRSRRSRRSSVSLEAGPRTTSRSVGPGAAPPRRARRRRHRRDR